MEAVFFNDTATTEIYTLSLHDALPISAAGHPGRHVRPRRAAVLGHVGQRLDHHEVRGDLHRRGDRKSTRLNSSHANISYAVFCLKKKKKHSYHTIGKQSICDSSSSTVI